MLVLSECFKREKAKTLAILESPGLWLKMTLPSADSDLPVFTVVSRPAPCIMCHALPQGEF